MPPVMNDRLRNLAQDLIEAELLFDIVAARYRSRGKKIICRIFARCGGFAATVSGGNQRAMVESTSAVIPCVRAMAMRSSHCWADAGVDAQGESHTITRSSRSGWRCARPIAVAPPSERPQK